MNRFSLAGLSLERKGRGIGIMFTVQKARFRRGTCEDLLLMNGESGPIASELRGNEPQQIWYLLVENDAGKLLAGTAHGKEVWV